MKDYKKILEGVVDIINTAEKSDIGFVNICSYIGENCPELKESEDERIRKELIEQVIYIVPNDDEVDNEGNVLPTYQKRIDKYRAWLEKQVPPHLSHDDEIMIRQLTEYFTTGKGLQNTNDTVVEWLEDVKRKLEKQGEQKPSMEGTFVNVDEVKESEDEKIRKDIIAFIKKRDRSGCDYDYDKWIDWLEMQGEQKPINPNAVKDLERAILAAHPTFEQKSEKKELKKSQRMIAAEAKEALYDKPAWSEEDEKVLEYLSMMYEESEFDANCIVYQNRNTGFEITAGEFNSFVKSLKDRATWKPSEEQLELLKDASMRYEGLQSLYDDLKKL